MDIIRMCFDIKRDKAKLQAAFAHFRQLPLRKSEANVKALIHCAVQQPREDMKQFLTAYLLQHDGVVCRVPAEPAARRVRVAPEARLRGRQRLPALVYRFQAWRSLTAFFLTQPFYIIIQRDSPIR